MKALLLSSSLAALLMATPVHAQASRNGDEYQYSISPWSGSPGYGSDDDGQKVERPTAPQEFESSDHGQNVPLSQRIDTENPASPSMNGPAD